MDPSERPAQSSSTIRPSNSRNNTIRPSDSRSGTIRPSDSKASTLRPSNSKASTLRPSDSNKMIGGQSPYSVRIDKTPDESKRELPTTGRVSFNNSFKLSPKIIIRSTTKAHSRRCASQPSFLPTITLSDQPVVNRISSFPLPDVKTQTSLPEPETISKPKFFGHKRVFSQPQTLGPLLQQKHDHDPHHISPKSQYRPLRPHHKKAGARTESLIKSKSEPSLAWIRPRTEVDSAFDEFYASVQPIKAAENQGANFSANDNETKSVNIIPFQSLSPFQSISLLDPTKSNKLKLPNKSPHRSPKKRAILEIDMKNKKSLESQEDQKEKKEEKEEKKERTKQMGQTPVRKAKRRSELLPNVTPNDIVGKQLKKVPVLSQLTRRERSKLGGVLVLEKHDFGDVIVQQDSLGKGFYILKVGKAIVQRTMKGVTTELDVLEKGDYFGETSLLTHSKTSASIVAQEYCEVWFLDEKYFASLFEAGAFKKQIHFAKRSGKMQESKSEDELFRKRRGSIMVKTGNQEKFIFECIQHNPLLKGLEYYGILKLISKMWRVEIPKGTRVITQGEIGGNFFVVQKGKLNVYMDSFDGSQMIKCETLQRKSVFGELSVLYNTPRITTVISANQCILWTLDRFVFNRILRNISSRQLGDYKKFLKQVPLFAPLSVRERAKIAEAIQEEKYFTGDVIMRQGENTEKNFGFASMYIIVSGLCRVEQVSGHRIHEINTLKRYNYFGERALLNNVPRSATVTCLTDVHLLKLDRQAVTLLLSPIENVMIDGIRKYRQKDSLGIPGLEEKGPRGSSFSCRQSGSYSCRGSEETRDGSRDGSNDCSIFSKSFVSKPYITKSKPKMADLIILGTLGKGSYGLVRLVRSKITHETYALKAVSRTRIKKVKHQDHLINEKRLLEKLYHPFLINLQGTFKDAKNIYYLMEPALGGELFTLMRSHILFDNATAKFYSACVVLVLGYMHSQNIIFRDLKPENVLIDSQGYCKVTDFGFAKELDEHGRTYTLCGTPAYLSPEIVARKSHGTSVDWWAMGVFIYEMLTGKTPFRVRGESMKQLYIRISEGKFSCPQELSEDAQDIISKFLVVDPSTRLGVVSGGVETIKQQAWFRGFDFTALEKRRLRPPIIPFIESNTDMHHFAWFDDRKTNQPVTEENNPNELYFEDPYSWDAEF